MTELICAAHLAVVEAEDRPAISIVAGFALCENCATDAVHQVVAEARTNWVRSPAEVVADEIARCAERGFL